MKSPLAKAMLLTTVILMDILGGAEVDLFIPSFPELQKIFNLSPFWVEALLSVNFAGFCLSLLFVGALADRYGRKPIILLGLATFIVGSMFCLWAPSYHFLLAGRFLQGVGVAAPTTLCFLIIADLYPIKEQQFLMAMLNGVANASVGIAPVVGSYVTLFFHWQGNFTALLLLGVMVFAMTVLFIPAFKLPDEKETLSLKGYIPIFRTKALMLMMFTVISFSVTYWVFIGISPILYMEDLGVSLIHFGFYQGALAMIFALGSVLSGLIISKCDQKKLLTISAWCCVASMVILGLITLFNSDNPLIITLAFLPFSMAIVIPVTVIYPLCLAHMPNAKGRVSAVMQGTRLVITAFALQVAGYFYMGSFQNIGIIVTSVFFLGIVTLFMIIKNKEIAQKLA